MNTRITIRDLRLLATRLNELTGSPLSYCAEGGGSTIGHYHISCAYGGYCLHRTISSGGGIITVVSSGHIPARPLYDQIQAYIAGLEAAKELS
jgi:hypothetical protein